MRALIQANADEIRRLHKRIHETVRYRERSQEQLAQWQAACREMHDRYDSLAFPGGYSTAKERLAAGDADTIEAALCFVEVRPYFFRSGYMFKDLLRMLKRAKLSASQNDRLAGVLSAYEAWREAKRRAPRT